MPTRVSRRVKHCAKQPRRSVALQQDTQLRTPGCTLMFSHKLPHKLTLALVLVPLWRRNGAPLCAIRAIDGQQRFLALKAGHLASAAGQSPRCRPPPAPHRCPGCGRDPPWAPQSSARTSASAPRCHCSNDTSSGAFCTVLITAHTPMSRCTGHTDSWRRRVSWRMTAELLGSAAQQTAPHPPGVVPVVVRVQDVVGRDAQLLQGRRDRLRLGGIHHRHLAARLPQHPHIIVLQGAPLTSLTAPGSAGGLLYD